MTDAIRLPTELETAQAQLRILEEQDKGLTLWPGGFRYNTKTDQVHPENIVFELGHFAFTVGDLQFLTALVAAKARVARAEAVANAGGAA